MMSMRSIARAAPRTFSRLSARAVASPVRTSMLRAAKPISATPIRTATAAFSTSISRRAPAGETDEELANKLASELDHETNLDEPEPTSIKDFLENSPFKLVDTPGLETVVLKRDFGNEKITVTFNIADLNNEIEEEDPYSEDPALADEEADYDSKSRSKDSALDDADMEEEDEMNDFAVPCRLNVIVEKPGQGALSIDASAQQGQISVEQIFFFKDAALAHASSPEASHKARDIYPGPQFGSLDPDLQVLWERYLEERGVSQALAVFLPDFMDNKEQREYVSWLGNIKKFIEA